MPIRTTAKQSGMNRQFIFYRRTIAGKKIFYFEIINFPVPDTADSPLRPLPSIFLHTRSRR